MGFEQRFNRILDRLWAWGRWQVGLIEGTSSSTETKASRPASNSWNFLIYPGFGFRHPYPCE